jgi:hypothetical protein
MPYTHNETHISVTGILKTGSSAMKVFHIHSLHDRLKTQNKKVNDPIVKNGADFKNAKSYVPVDYLGYLKHAMVKMREISNN